MGHLCRKKLGGLLPGVCFGLLWNERIRWVYNGVEQLDQAIKLYLMSSFFGLGFRVYVEDHSMSMIEFVD